MHADMSLISDLDDLSVDVLTTALGSYYYVVALANAFFLYNCRDVLRANTLNSLGREANGHFRSFPKDICTAQQYVTAWLQNSW